MNQGYQNKTVKCRVYFTSIYNVFEAAEFAVHLENQSPVKVSWFLNIFYGHFLMQIKFSDSIRAVIFIVYIKNKVISKTHWLFSWSNS